MEPLKKKGKKGFAVPVVKVNTEPEDGPKSHSLKVNKNKMSTIPSVTSTTASMKAKNDENPTKKMKKKKKLSNEKKQGEDDKRIEDKVVQGQPTNTEDKHQKECIPTMEGDSGNAQDKPAHTETLDRKAAVGRTSEKPKKQMRSLTEDEYDELFIAVLQSVMKSEDGDNDAEITEEKNKHKRVSMGTDNGDKNPVKVESGLDEDDEEPCEVKVIVQVQEAGMHEVHFDNVNEDDIDNWNPMVHTEDIPKDHVETPKSDKNCNEGVLSSPNKEKSTKRSSVPNSSELVKKKKFSVPDKPTQTGKEKKQKNHKKVKGDNTSQSQSQRAPITVTVKLSAKQKMTERELEDLGTWVQCGNNHCLKWRYLTDVTDPMEIPDRWECSMNINESCNSCSKPEECYDESEHIYTKYTEGSVVLARMAGYPWWPAMIEIDPDFDTCFEVDVPSSMYPTKYHVVFFDNNVSRAWISLSAIKPFQGLDILPRKHKGHNYTREVNTAIKNAEAALELSIKERLKKFSFAARFSGKWGQSKGKKSEKQKKSKSVGPQRRQSKRKPDLEEEDDRLLDDDTLSEILNSQTMFSDVEDILGSMESSLLDDKDASFHSGTPCSHTKEIKLEQADKLEGNCSQKSVEVQLIEVPTKFKFDSDIFTMEMDSQEVTSSNQALSIENDDGSTTEKRSEDERSSLESENDDDAEICRPAGKVKKARDDKRHKINRDKNEIEQEQNNEKPNVDVKLEISTDKENPSLPVISSRGDDVEVDVVEKAKRKQVKESVEQVDRKPAEKRKSESDTSTHQELKHKKMKKKEMKSRMASKDAENEEVDNLQSSQCEGKENIKEKDSIEIKLQPSEKSKSKAGKRRNKSISKSSDEEEKRVKSKPSGEINGKMKKCGKSKSTVECDSPLINNQDGSSFGSECDKITNKTNKEDAMQQSLSSQKNNRPVTNCTGKPEIQKQKKKPGIDKNIELLDHVRNVSQQSSKSQTQKNKFQVKRKNMDTNSSDEIDSDIFSQHNTSRYDTDSDNFMLDFDNDVPAVAKMATSQQSSVITSTDNGEHSEPLDFEE